MVNFVYLPNFNFHILNMPPFDIFNFFVIVSFNVQ